MKSRVFILYIVLNLSGCATKIDNHFVSKNFTADHLVNNTLIIAGVYKLGELWNEEESLSYQRQIARRINRLRSEINVSPSVGNWSQSKDYYPSQVRHALITQKALPVHLLQNLRHIYEGNRYVAYMVFDNDLISKEENESPVLDKDGKNKGNKYKRVYSVKRQITTDFFIYDIRSSSLVWSGQLKISDTNKNEFMSHHEPAFFKKIRNDIIESIIYGDRYRYPDPPSFEDLLKLSVDKFAKALPKKSCSDLGTEACVKRFFRWL